MAMIVLSLLPVGIVQFFASVEHGYWFARSPAVIQSDLVRTLVWNRVWGDVIFAAGAILLGYFIFGLIKGAVGKRGTDGVTDLSAESKTT
jgi:nitric oxide reductase subunit B